MFDFERITCAKLCESIPPDRAIAIFLSAIKCFRILFSNTWPKLLNSFFFKSSIFFHHNNLRLLY